MSTKYYRLDLDVTLRDLLRARQEGEPAVDTYFAGVEVGMRVTERVVLAPDDVLVSEYGNITTVAQLRAAAGSGRREAKEAE